MSDKKSEPEIAKVIELEVPIELPNGEIIKQLNLIRPKAKHLRKMPGEGMTVGDMLTLAGKLARQPNHVIDELDGKDIEKVTEAIGDFF